MNIKGLGLLGAFIFAAPLAAVAAPATSLTAHTYTNLTSAPQAASDAAVAPGDTAKVEKVWWRGRGWGWRGGWRGYGWRGYGFRGPYLGFYGVHRPYWRRHYYY